MTNSWTDIDNTSFVLVWGANPSENHPACFAHINAARARGAAMVVVDPRKTRTALQADRYIRIRPGTDMALQNAVIRGIIGRMEAGDPKAAQFYKFLNQGSAGSFYTDGDASHSSKYVTNVPSGVCSKYTDARFIVNAAGSDYDREKIVASTGLPATTETADLTISNYPKKSSDCRTGSTVYNALKAHVQPYDNATVAGICGCTSADIDFLVDMLIANGRCSSVADVLASQDPNAAGYKCTTILYAMGMTQHTNGAIGIKGFANIQTLLGNMGRAGGGINALRGIHNVQGSTDMGLLYGNIPAYSSNPSTMSRDASGNPTNGFGKYMDALWGGPLSGTAASGAPRAGTFGAMMNGSYDNAYVETLMDWQQRGFYNMVRTWFGSPAWASTGRTNVDGLYDLWPKGNGDDHITMFRQMAAGGYTKALMCWGQNPAITEPNQGAVRAGLENLDTLVVVDMYETETAAVKRKDGAATYLIPACSHVEEAGSVTNSARTLQWREECTKPKGNTKADIELLLRLAHALDEAGAFTHITDEWAAKGYTTNGFYKVMYGDRYGWFPGGGTEFEDFTFTDADTQVWTGLQDAPSAGNYALKGSEAMCEQIFREMMKPVGSGGCLWIYTGAFNNGATWTTDNKASGQTNWTVRNRAKSRNGADDSNIKAYHGWGYSWLVNRRVFYNNGDIPGDVADYFMGPDSASRLFSPTNRNVMNYSRWYRTHHRVVDMPDVCLPLAPLVGGVGETGTKNNGTDANIGHVYPGRFPSFTEPYETPKANDAAYMAKWGRNSISAKWDCVKADTKVAGRGFTIAGGKPVDDPPASQFPLVLTTIRCVEHFQGGPTTRNNEWNVETEPEPWIEINPVDARAAGINNGDLVNVITARGNSTSDQLGRTKAGYDPLLFGTGFRARVDSTISSKQRVGVGVVAIPWHWGDRGVGQGSRANDLCIDSCDANTKIPEYKACLCRIERA